MLSMVILSLSQKNTILDSQRVKQFQILTKSIQKNTIVPNKYHYINVDIIFMNFVKMKKDLSYRKPRILFLNREGVGNK